MKALKSLSEIMVFEFSGLCIMYLSASSSISNMISWKFFLIV
jgi:hypothetical protein